MSAGPGSKFGFNNKTGELVLTDIYGAQKIYPIISRANTSMPSIYFLALEGNRVAEVSPKDPGSGPEEGCFENKTKTMSMKFIETENPIEYINHKKLFFITPTSLSPEDKMSGMRLLTAQLHERHSGFNPLVLKESELAEAMKLVAQNREELASVNYQKTMIVFSNNPEHFYVVQLSLKDPIKPKVLVLELGHLEDLQKIKENLDETSLYTHTYPMQRTESDCYSFALYLAKRLEVIERYIPNGRDGTPGELFKYLELHIEEVQEGINASKLPLALVLSTQSSQLWKTIIKTYPPEEQRHVMTKRGEIFDDLIGLEGQQGRHKKIIEELGGDKK